MPTLALDHPSEHRGTSQVSIYLRAEGAAMLAASLIAYQQLGLSWWLFAALILAPDLSLLPYLANRRIGALTYNAIHTYLAPALLVATGYGANQPLLYSFAAIWAAHIGLDRMVGYGLKFNADPRDTHLSRLSQTQ